MEYQSKKNSKISVLPFPPISGPFTVAEAVPKFLECMEFDLRLSPHTMIAYRRFFRAFILPTMSDMSVQEITPEDCYSVTREFVKGGMGLPTQHKLIMTFRSFFRYASRRLQLPVFDFRDLEVPRLERKEVTFLTADELRKTFDSLPGRDIYELRMRAFIEVLFGSMMRISEALSLNRTEIRWEEKEVIVLGKGNKERVVFLSDRCLEWLKKYLEMRTDNNPALFVTHSKTGVRRWGHKCVRSLLGKYQKEWGIPKRIHPHLFRHSGVTHMLFNGADLRSVQTAAGHASERTTLHYYAGVDKRRAKVVHQKCMNVL